MPLRVIGDVHAQFDFSLDKQRSTYKEIVADSEFSVQIGDMGDGETYRQLQEYIDPKLHRFFAGNHDHYPYLPPHSLGDFGSKSHGEVDFFFVRGCLLYTSDAADE